MVRQEDSESDRRRELADFLRTRRERLMPEQVGLPIRKRRRTPGLRREDVAELLDISATWYTWLEQGRAIQFSRDVVEDLASVLQLNEDERAHLFHLSRQPLPPAPSSFTGTVQPAFQMVLTALEPFPAHIRDSRWNVLAWNRAELLLNDWGAYPPGERNIVWHHFAHPRIRRLMLNWEQEARTLLALFRMESAQHLNDPWFITIIEQLQQLSPEFRDWWSFHEVQQQREHPITFAHPAMGQLILQPVTVQFTYDPRLFVRMLLSSPETETTIKLREMLSAQVEQGEQSEQA